MVLHIKAILDRLGLDFGGSWGRCCAFWAPSWLQLGAQERSRAAQECPRDLQERPRAAQERPRFAQEPPMTAQEPPKSAQDGPGAAQEPPKRAQEPPKSRPRCPGAAQDLTRAPPRSCQEPGPKPRITHDLKKLPTSPRTSLELLSSPQSGRNQKRAAAVLPTRGLQSAAQPGTACWITIPRSSCPSKPISLDQVPDSKVLGA